MRRAGYSEMSIAVERVMARRKGEAVMKKEKEDRLFTLA